MDNPQMHNSNLLTTQHRRLRICCAELDTTIQEVAVKLLDREPSGDGDANRNSSRREERDG
jgi:hypothetical protein